MAEVIVDERRVVVEPWWVKARIVFIGAGIGLGWWVLTAILRQYVIEPIACRDLATASACVGSFGLAGNIAAILIAIVGSILLVRFMQPRPIIIAVASAAVLWSLGTYMTGLAWWEMALWSIGLYAASYTLFSMIGRIPSLVVSLIVAVMVAVGIRLLLLI